MEKEMAKKVSVKDNQTDSVKKLMGVLTKKLEERYSSQNSIERTGQKLIVPEYMSLRDAANALVQWEKTMETETEKQCDFYGHPSDLLLAAYTAMNKSFGNVIGDSSVQFGFFGPQKIPGQSKTIQVDYNEKRTLPYGKITIPGLPVDITLQIKEHKQQLIFSTMLVYFTYRKKFEPLVEMIEQEINRELEGNSVFAGKAIDSQWNFINLNGFPIERIAYSKMEEEQLNSHMFRLIKSTDLARKKGINIKRTILLHGRYGTGKTLTALKAANVCVGNNWTFMNVLPGDDIQNALEFAKRFQPCCVFFEDIDQVTNSDSNRDKNVNGILNTIDGLLSKSSEVMTILTTNHTDDIERAMLRPGRIDAVIEMGLIDEQSLFQLIQNYVGSQLCEEVKTKWLLGVCKGYTPAFIAEACNRALLYAMERTQGETNGLGITNEDLHNALSGLRSQYDLMIGQKKVSEFSIDQAVKDAVSKGIHDVRKIVEDVNDRVVSIQDTIR